MDRTRSHKIMVVSILVAAIAVVPISYYEIPASHPNITTTSFVSPPVFFKHNLSAPFLPCMYPYLKFGTSSSIISQSGYNNSYLNFTAGVGAFETHPNSFQQVRICPQFLINGSFAPDLHPTSFSISVAFFVGNHSYGNLQAHVFSFYTGWSRNDSFVGINHCSGSQFRYLFSLQNNTQNTHRYLFGTSHSTHRYSCGRPAPSNGTYLAYNTCFGSPFGGGSIYNLTMKVTLSMSIYGKQINDPIIFHILNTGAKQQ